MQTTKTNTLDKFIFRFGKTHKGKTFQQIMDNHKNYIKFLYSKQILQTNTYDCIKAFNQFLRQQYKNNEEFYNYCKTNNMQIIDESPIFEKCIIDYQIDFEDSEFDNHEDVVNWYNNKCNMRLYINFSKNKIENTESGFQIVFNKYYQGLESDGNKVVKISQQISAGVTLHSIIVHKIIDHAKKQDLITFKNRSIKKDTEQVQTDTVEEVSVPKHNYDSSDVDF